MSVDWYRINRDLHDDRQVEIPATEYGGGKGDKILLSSAWPAGGHVVSEIGADTSDFEEVFSGKAAEAFIDKTYRDELSAEGVKAYAEAAHRLVAKKLEAVGLYEPGVEDGRFTVEISGAAIKVTSEHVRGRDSQWWAENIGAVIAVALADTGAIYREMHV